MGGTIIGYSLYYSRPQNTNAARMHLISTSMPALDDTETQECELSVLIIHTAHISINATQMSCV